MIMKMMMMIIMIIITMMTVTFALTMMMITIIMVILISSYDALRTLQIMICYSHRGYKLKVTIDPRGSHR